MTPISRIDEIKFVQLKKCCGNAQGASVDYALRRNFVLTILLRILNIVTRKHSLLEWQNRGVTKHHTWGRVAGATGPRLPAFALFEGHGR